MIQFLSWPANPSSFATPFIASMQNAMCSSRSTPSAAAPWVMSSRLTLRAKALSFIFLRTDLASTSARDLPGFHQCGGGNEPGQLVAGEQCLLHGRHPGHVGIIGMGEDGAAHLFRISALFEDIVSHERVLGRRGIFFIIEVVQQAGDA